MYVSYMADCFRSTKCCAMEVLTPSSCSKHWTVLSADRVNASRETMNRLALILPVRISPYKMLEAYRRAIP